MDKPSTLAERLAAQRGEVFRSRRGMTLGDRLAQAREETAEAGEDSSFPASVR